MGGWTHLIGSLLALTSMVLGCQRWALTQYVMQRSEPDSALGQMSKLRFMSWNMPVTAFVCFTLTLIYEPDAYKPETLLNPEVAINVAKIAAGGLCLVFAELKLVEMAGAVAVQVLATIHQIPIVLAGVVFFNERITSLAAVGFGMCLAGGLIYVKARQQDAAIAQAAPQATPELQED